MTSRGYWILDERGQAAPATVEEWGNMIKNGANRIARDEVMVSAGTAEISTVLLGADHSFRMGGPPLLFETMIFGGPHDEYQKRYSTRAEAEAGHAVAVALVRGGEVAP